MTTNQVTQTDPGARARVIKLGLDVHASLIVVVRQVDERASQPPQRFSEEAFIGFVNRQLAQSEAVHSCYEALAKMCFLGVLSPGAIPVAAFESPSLRHFQALHHEVGTGIVDGRG